MVKREKQYTFFSDGNSYSFYPNRSVYDIFQRRKRTALEFHQDLVEFRKSPTVFILDETGKNIRD